MNRFKEHPYSTTIGIFYILVGIGLLFIETKIEIPIYALASLEVAGVLLIFAKDKLIDILTFGLSRLITDLNNKIK